MFKYSWWALAVVLCLASVVGSAEELFVQDRFAIGLWVDPPVDDQAEARYKELADANFTMVIGGFDEKKLALCEQHNLRLIAHAPNDAFGDIADSAALWGFALRDEPSAAEFPALRERVDAVHRAHPGKLAYINLFPDYADASQLGTATYEEHVRQFMDIVQPRVLSMDHYPIFRPDSDGRDAYCGNLGVMRSHALKGGIPFWNFFNSMPYGPHTDPTEAQLCWQVNASLAYGAKGVMYFCYYTPGGDEFPKGGAIIRQDGRRTRHYAEAQRINARLKHLGPVLMRLTSTQVARVNESAGDAAAEVPAGMPIVGLKRGAVDPPQDYLVGAFTHEDGRRGVLLCNYRFALTAWPTVTFDAPLDQVKEIDPNSGEEVPVLDDSPNMEGLQLSLGAGDARLFLLP